MTINEKIFNLLESKNLRQVDLAKTLNLTTGQITAWKKRGTTPPAEYLADICKFLGITVNELLNAESINLTENEKELLILFNQLSEREQIKFIGRLEEFINNKGE